MRSLQRMFADKSRGCVFMETVMMLRKQPHTVIECVPLDYDTEAMVPMYFKVSKFRVEVCVK